VKVAGHDEGLTLMETTDPLILLITLPLVPVGLMIGKMVRWQEPIIRVSKITNSFPSDIILLFWLLFGVI
jgi:hypothetical protein